MSAQVPIRPSMGPPALRAALVLLVALVVTGGAAVATTAASPGAARTFVGWSVATAAVLVCAAATVAAYSAQSARNTRDRFVSMRQDTNRLLDDTLPELLRRLRDGASADTALAGVTQPADTRHRRILHTLAVEISQGERQRAAAMTTCANAAGRVQAMTTRMLADLRDMEDRHDENVLGDLLKIDHSTAQAGRLADSIAVLTGARSGRRWTKPIVMESILRGAMGRISSYRRIRLHSTCQEAIVGYAAEGVMHALAELMDNATNFSPPSEEAHVYVEEVQAGIVVTIEDGGLVMGELALRRAERAVSPEPLDLTTLSGTRMGLAVVGSLARKHGLTVSFRPSSRGGTGVVVMIPRPLITEPKQSAMPPTPRRQSLPDTASPDAEQVGTGSAEPRVTAADALTERTVRSEPADNPDTVRLGTSVPERPAAPEPMPAASGSAEPARAEQSSGAGRGADESATGRADDSGEAPGLPKRRRGQTLAGSLRQPPAAPTSKPNRSSTEAGARFGSFRRAAKGGPVEDGSATGESGGATAGPDGDR